MITVLDEKDSKILGASLLAWNDRTGPRVGDWCRMPDGAMRRFTYEWPDGFQTTIGDCVGGGASFYFGAGYMNFSGSLDRVIDRSRIKPTTETKPGAIWFFHHNEARAHNGVYVDVECRVFEVTP